jgi:hypothetical protein
MCLTGEAGIGKSTLLAEIRELARNRGYTIAPVISHEDAWQPPYAPWMSILDHLGQPSFGLLPETGDIPTGEHRFRMQAAMLDAIRAVATQTPVAIVFDDLQWLDSTSRDMLLHLVRQLETVPVVVYLAWRTPVAPGEFSTWIGNIYRESRCHWLELHGISEPGVAEIMRQHDWDASPSIVRDLTATTNGNPFYVTEISRLVQESGLPSSRNLTSARNYGIPESIRHVVDMRLQTVPEPVRQMLRIAAIFAGSFDVSLLRETSGMAEDELLDALDTALASDFVRPVEDRPEQFRFAHDIVRETLAASWNPGRLARWHRRAAEALEHLHGGRTAPVAGDLALHYLASRSIPGAERGVTHALASAEQAAAGFDFAQSAAMLDIAATLAHGESATMRADIAWRRAIALAESLQIDAATTASEEAIALLCEAGVSPEALAAYCWKLAHILNAIGAPAAIRNRLREEGLRAVGDRRDLAWARLVLLADAIEVVPGNTLYVARWIGFDPQARQIAENSPSETDQVQTVESFDPRTLSETRALIARARNWQQSRSTLRGLTAAANDLTYRHGEFQQALAIWNEILGLARRTGAVPWQANALNQMVLLHVTLGDFDQAAAIKQIADSTNALLGPASDTGVLAMERDFALAHYLDGDWAGQSTYWLQFAAATPQGLEAQLAAPLYAAMTTVAAANAGAAQAAVRELLDALVDVAAIPGIQQMNGVVGWAAEAIHRLQWREYAATFDRLAEDLMAAGVGDYPQTSLHLSRARMLNLLGDGGASAMFDHAREQLSLQGQRPLLGIACFDQAQAVSTSPEQRQHLLKQAKELFAGLGMTHWRNAPQQQKVPQPPPRQVGIPPFPGENWRCCI